MAEIGGPVTLETNDLSQFSSTVIDQQATFQAQSTVVQNGTYALEFQGGDSNDRPDSTYGRINFTYPATNVVIARTFFRTPADNASTSSITGSALVNAMLIFYSASGRQAWINWYVTVANLPGQSQGYFIAKDGTETQIGTGSVSWSANTWYLLELKIDKSGADPVISWRYSSDAGQNWTSGGEVTDSTTGTNGINADSTNLRVGFVNHSGNWQRNAFHFYFDDITVYDAEPSGAVEVERTVTPNAIASQKTLERIVVHSVYAVGTEERTVPSSVVAIETAERTVTPVTAQMRGMLAFQPDEDVSIGGWETNVGGTTNLYSLVDEAGVNQVDDYIISNGSTASDALELGLVSVPDPNLSDSYRVVCWLRKDSDGLENVNVLIELLQGTTVIASRTVNNVPSTLTFYTLDLTSAEIDSITNHADLRIRITKQTT